jgi:hypothetical protein
MAINMKLLMLLFFLANITLFLCNKTNAGIRKEISLNGKWDIAESLSGNKMPDNYSHKIIVPGFVDLASPSFDSTGVKCYKRNYYWYRRFFKINDPLLQVAFLKINKAVYGTDVYLNGNKVGSNLFCFTPTLLDIKKYLKPSGERNELLIRVGAYYDAVPDSIPVGMDFEKIHYLSGIYDDVEIILSGIPFIDNIQIAPDVNNKLIRVEAEIRSDKKSDNFELHYSVVERNSSKEVVSGKTKPESIDAINENVIDFTIPVKNCHLWSPEDPFLYHLIISTGGDNKKITFGMRSFTFDGANNHAVLNGKPYSMLGTNICFFRFSEDSSRGNLPWNEKWVRKLFGKFKEMNWNCIRYCIGFPPEKWYQIADETGFLIQNEYPVWYGPDGNSKIKADVLTEEYTRWMREQWNHPCVVIWDAQNETVTNESGKAIDAVRHLDMSNRPWDNGWGVPQSDNDCIESHPYLFMQYKATSTRPTDRGYLNDLFNIEREPDFNDANQYSPSPKGRYKNAVVINEYDWLWLNRNGSVTFNSDSVYIKLFGGNISVEKRRIIHAENIAILTEYWRCHRKAAALMHFCELGYSRPYEPKGFTSDDWIDVKNLIFEPNFEKYVKHEFLPVCIMIDKWDKIYSAGEAIQVPVYCINDLNSVWEGTLKLTLKDKNKKIIVLKRKISIPGFGKTIVDFNVNIPKITGNYQLIAETLFKNDIVKSIRNFSIK